MKSGDNKPNLGFTSFFVSLFLFSCLGLGLLLQNKKTNPITSISFLDVGQGDAIFIEAPNKVQVLVDAGPNTSVIGALADVLPFWDRVIDMIIPTHADKDHIGGFPAVFERFTVQQVYDTQNTATTSIYEEFARLRDVEGAEIFEASSADTIVLDEDAGVYLRILFPGKDLQELDRNDTSTVIQLIHGEVEVMLTGDASTMVEEYLVYLYEDSLRSEILKAGHHGSHTSTSELFLETVNPELVIISAGAGNSYGHPHEDVVDRISSFGAGMLETSKMGTITLETDGQYIWVK